MTKKKTVTPKAEAKKVEVANAPQMEAIYWKKPCHFNGRVHYGEVSKLDMDNFREQYKGDGKWENWFTPIKPEWTRIYDAQARANRK